MLLALVRLICALRSAPDSLAAPQANDAAFLKLEAHKDMSTQVGLKERVVDALSCV